MPFGLKNAGATYKRAIHTIFHDMIHDMVEDYVDDIVVKSKKEKNYITDRRRVFKWCKKYKLKMNMKKYAFGMTTEKLLGFLVYNKGIENGSQQIKGCYGDAPT